VIRSLARSLLIVAALASTGGRALAGDLSFLIGPPSVGAGGANPVSVPPTAVNEWEFVWVSDSKYETTISVFPGLFFGGRSETGNVYVSFGGGAVIDQNGAGPGCDAAFGFHAGKTFRFTMELRQAVGFDFSSNTVLSPYAVRIGASLRF
jgi:hypothetical protein